MARLFRLSSIALLGSLYLVACGGMQSANETAQLQSNGAIQEALTPDDPDCPPSEGNDKGVGKPCTKGGGECKGTGAPFCSIEASDHAPVAFCTKPCFNSSQCGKDATCTADPQAPILKACVPNTCL